MSWARNLGEAIRDLRLSLFIVIASVLLIYFPYQMVGLTKPSIISEHEEKLVVAGILAAANVAIHFVEWLFAHVRSCRFKSSRRKKVQQIFHDLNYQELCVILYCTIAGVRAFKATPQSVIIISLQQKQCIHLVSGVQSPLNMHFNIFDDIFELVRKQGTERLPAELLAQPDWQEKVREVYHESIDWRKW